MGYCIYKICCDDCDYVYIGSTQNFTKRKCRHKSDCNNENSKSFTYKIYQTIRENGGWDNWRMVCVEELGDITKTQAYIREEEWRVKLKANLNMVKSYITEEEKKEYQQEYYEQNRDKLTDNHKQYYDKNRDKILEEKRKYYQQNRDKIVEYKKEYREHNRDKIAEQKKEYYKDNRDKILERIKCECECIITKKCINRHKKSAKHQAWEWRQTALCEV